MKKILLFLLSIISNLYLIYAQPSIEWQKGFGGTSLDVTQSIQQTTDGGYIVAGYSDSNDSNVTGNHGGYDYWIVKLNTTGANQWQKSLGGSNYDFAKSIQQTTDGGYIVVGFTLSNDGDVTGNHGNYDCWIVKLDSIGNLQWQKSYGGTLDEIAFSIQQTNDGGYIVAGYSVSNDGDVTGNHGGSDYWILKLDIGGAIQWQKSLGGTKGEEAKSIKQTTDGGYIVAGSSLSNDGDVTGNHGGYDYWIVKLNTTGVIQWQKSLGGAGIDCATFIQQTSDGGYIVSGSSVSNDGDVTGNHGSSDYWIVKLDITGVIQWQRSLGGTGIDNIPIIQQTTDRGYIVAGYSDSNNGDVIGNHGGLDSWIVKLDSIGNLQWQKSYGGTADDGATFIQQTTDGGYIFSGFTLSIDGDLTGNNVNKEFWIVKLSSIINVNEIQNSISNFQISPNPFSGETVLSFNLASSKNVSIEINDIEGRVIKNFNNKILSIGSNELLWDATNNTGSKIEDGIYFITIVSDNISETKKVVVIRN